MSTANFGVLYTQVGGGGILPTDLAYTDRDNEFSVEQTFTVGIAIEGQATTNADANTPNSLVRLSQTQDLILEGIQGFNADGNTWGAPQTFDAKAVFNAGALFQNVAPQSSVDVTGSADPTVIPNKEYVDTAIAGAVGVRTDTVNTWTAQQIFEAQVNISSVTPMIVGAGGIESAGILTATAVINANSGLSCPTPQNDILSGNSQTAISSNPNEYYFEMPGKLIDIDATFGVPTILYTKRAAGDPGDVCVVNLPDVTEEMYGKRLLFVCTLMPIQLNASVIRSSDGFHTGALLGLGESVSLVAMFLGADSGWYVYGHEGTINYS